MIRKYNIWQHHSTCRVSFIERTKKRRILKLTAPEITKRRKSRKKRDTKGKEQK
jgi:hypothetical protein